MKGKEGKKKEDRERGQHRGEERTGGRIGNRGRRGGKGNNVKYGATINSLEPCKVK